ncbi:MAG: TrkH family potassium uptake protein [Eubacteriales bacterium]
MNKKMVFYTVGQMIWLEALLMLFPAAVSLCYSEHAVWAFFTAILAALAIGTLMVLLSRPDDYVIYAKEGFVIVAFSWLAMSFIGALPFVISGEIPSYIDALFETVSGFTTTGASILADVESVGYGINFWRCFTHWIGGMGVLVFIMAVIPNFSDRSIHIMRAEMPGPIVGKLMPKVKDTAKVLYLIYIAITALEFIMLVCGGMPVYDSLVHSFATAGTGGFGIMNDSIASYSPYCQWVIAAFMLLFGVNFNVYYMILIKRASTAFKSTELWIYLGIVAAASTAVCINVYPLFENISDAVRSSVFQVTSIMTTTGFVTTSTNAWPEFSKSVLLLLMFIGGCAGSTAGGFKVSRLIILAKALKSEMKHMLHPRSVNTISFEGKKLEKDTVTSVSVYMIAYVFSLFMLLLLLSFEPLDTETKLTAAMSCFNNVGPFFSRTVSCANYSVFSPFSKLLLSAAMLLGRLEIFPILIVFSPSIWSKK